MPVRSGNAEVAHCISLHGANKVWKTDSSAAAFDADLGGLSR